jgi:sRNA-binding carbon storage regulator CsrA
MALTINMHPDHKMKVQIGENIFLENVSGRQLKLRIEAPDELRILRIKKEPESGSKASNASEGPSAGAGLQSEDAGPKRAFPARIQRRV